MGEDKTTVRTIRLLFAMWAAFLTPAPHVAADDPPLYNRAPLIGTSLGFETDGTTSRNISAWIDADINGDGLGDLVLARWSGSFVEVTEPAPPMILLSDGQGSLINATSSLIDEPIPETHIARGLLVRDFNGDGNADIFFSNHGKEAIVDGEFPCEKNLLLLSQPNGRLRDVSNENLPPVLDFSHGSTASDIDGDGDVDIWVNNLGCKEPNAPAYLLENDGAGGFSVIANGPPAHSTPLPGFVGRNGRLPEDFEGAFWTLFVDANTDTYSDLFYEQAGTLGLLLNDGAGAFSKVPNAVQLESPLLDGIHDVHSADVDHDGDQDLILLDLGGPGGAGFMFRVLINNSDATFSEETSSRLMDTQPFEDNFGFPILNTADLDGDGNVEILYSTSGFEFAGRTRFDFTADASGNLAPIATSLIPSEPDTDGSHRFFPVDTTASGIHDLVTITDGPTGFPEVALVLYQAQQAPPPLVASVLPTVRSATTGSPVTAFASVINSGSAPLSDCRIYAAWTTPADFRFFATDPTTNQIVGASNAPIDLDPGQVGTFIFEFVPRMAFEAHHVPMTFDCTDSRAAARLPDLNNLVLSATDVPVPDIVALVATVGANGIVDVPGVSGASALAVASVNVGAPGSISVSADTGDIDLPISLVVCATNTIGECEESPSESISLQIPSDATPTFSVFVNGQGLIPFDPANNRIFIRFENPSGALRGGTSVAVRTTN